MLAPPRELVPPPRGNPGSAAGYHVVIISEKNCETKWCETYTDYDLITLD